MDEALGARKAQREARAQADTERADWTFTCPTSLLGRPIPPRSWVVDGWLPAGTVTINFGDGGTGKTLLAQQLMTSTATGLPWCGLAVKPCRSVALFCEDDGDELHRRQDAINLAYGVDFDSLADMRWASGVGHDNTLVEFDLDGLMRLTTAFHTLADMAKKHEAGLIVIDTAADTFGGNEILRRQVRQFVGKALGGLALATGAAVLLNAHPSRSGMGAGGDMDGGSTAWSNTARSRWSLSRPKAEPGEPIDNDARLLTRKKGNYAGIGDTIALQWQRGVLVPPAGMSGLERTISSGTADDVFLAMLVRMEGNGIRLSQSVKAGNYAPKQMASAPDRDGLTKRDLEGAMARLLHAGTIKVHDFGRPGRPERALVVTA